MECPRTITITITVTSGPALEGDNARDVFVMEANPSMYPECLNPNASSDVTNSIGRFDSPNNVPVILGPIEVSTCATHFSVVMLETGGGGTDTYTTGRVELVCPSMPPCVFPYESWKYRMRFNVTDNSGSGLTDFQVPIHLNTTTFNYDKANASGEDLRFAEDDETTTLDYWIENWNTSGNSTVWVKLNVSANSTETFYMYYGNPCAVGGKSNESNVFDYVDRGNQSTSWTLNGDAVQDSTNGDPAPSYNVTSTSGSYMYRDIGLVPGRVITFNVWTNGLGNFYCLANASGAGQHYRADSRGASNYSGWNTSVDWSSSLAPSSGFQTTASTWYKFTIVAANATSASYYYEQTTNSSPQISGTLEGTHPITGNGSFIGLVGDVLGAANSTRWDNIVVRKYASPPPTVNLGEEEANHVRTDYFGGTVGIAAMTNTTLSNGSVVLTGSPYDMLGTLTSTDISLGNSSHWSVFYANHSLPTNTGIGYQVLASNNSTLCTITAAEALAGYDISGCAGSISPIRIYANLSTTNTSVTPNLQKWSVTKQ